MDKRDGVSLIAAERKRQIDKEGWTPEHDAEHENDELALVASFYATPKDCRLMDRGGRLPMHWPSSWDGDWWKPTPRTRVRELVKAGALIAAEIDRLTRKP